MNKDDFEYISRVCKQDKDLEKINRFKTRVKTIAVRIGRLIMYFAKFLSCICCQAIVLLLGILSAPFVYFVSKNMDKEMIFYCGLSGNPMNAGSGSIFSWIFNKKERVIK